MMESEVTGNCHASFGERDRETHKSRDLKVRSVPTLLSPLLANIALNGIEEIHQSREHPDFASIQKYDRVYCFLGKPTLSFPIKYVLESISHFIATEE